MPAAAFVPALNALLPDDVRVLAAEDAPPEFHARFDAVARTYRYAVTFTDSVFTRRHAHYVPPPLDVAAMREAAASLVGERDFATFGNASEDYATTVRRLEELRVEETLAGVEFYLTANAFLYKMVRNVVAALLKVGRGEIAPEEVGRLLAARDRGALGPATGNAVWSPAPPQGLTLLGVRYRI
jgi:tRNA pseudouridine38-40 synthase